MPTVNFYFDNPINPKLNEIIPDIKKLIAEKLTCGEIKLTPEEISIRFIKVDGGQMIGNTEVEIAAASFSERVEKQDEICLQIAKYLRDKASFLGEVRVWLKLSELGHSWEQ